jgi:dipeptidyl aminopeptidase/acylaminoacyl peptidase
VINGNIFFTGEDGDLYSLDPTLQILQRFYSSTGLDGYTSVSQDGLWLAFQSDIGGDNEILLMDLQTHWVEFITENDFEDLSPSISPDGTQIAFVSDRTEVFKIWTYDIVSKEFKKVTDGVSQDSNPQYSPDGRLLLFESDRDGSPELYLSSTDGKDLIRLTNNHFEEIDPFWTDDGRIGHISPQGQILFLDQNGRPRAETGNIDTTGLLDVRFSPDQSQWVGFVLDPESGDLEFSIYPNPPLSASTPIHSDTNVFWSSIETALKSVVFSPPEVLVDSYEAGQDPEVRIEFESSQTSLDQTGEIRLFNQTREYTIFLPITVESQGLQSFEVVLPFAGNWQIDLFWNGVWQQSARILIP